MQPDRFAVANNWLAVAEDDVTVAREYAARLPNVSCFHSQQAAEKALNAILVALSGDVARTHLMDSLLEELDALKFSLDAAMREDALALAKFYVATRYPDALGGLNPAAAYLKGEADDAVARASRLIERARDAVSHERESAGE